MKIVDTIIIAAFGIVMALALVGRVAGCGGAVAVQGAAVAPAAEEDSAARILRTLAEGETPYGDFGGVSYAIGRGESRDLQMAIEKAEYQARDRLGNALMAAPGRAYTEPVLRDIKSRDGKCFVIALMRVMTMPKTAPPAPEGGMIMPQ